MAEQVQTEFRAQSPLGEYRQFPLVKQIPFGSYTIVAALCDLRVESRRGSSTGTVFGASVYELVGIALKPK